MTALITTLTCDGFEFLIGNSENIKRTSDINGVIYTAKAIEGLWFQGSGAPFGCKKSDIGEKRRLIPDDKEVIIVKFIYESYLADTPLYLIKRKAKELGFSRSGNSAIEDILSNPLYYGCRNVKPWKEQLGGLFHFKRF